MVPLLSAPDVLLVEMKVNEQPTTSAQVAIAAITFVNMTFRASLILAILNKESAIVEPGWIKLWRQMTTAGLCSWNLASVTWTTFRMTLSITDVSAQAYPTIVTTYLKVTKATSPNGFPMILTCTKSFFRAKCYDM